MYSFTLSVSCCRCRNSHSHQPNSQSPPVTAPTVHLRHRASRRRPTCVRQSYPRVSVTGEEPLTHFTSSQPCCASNSLLACPPYSSPSLATTTTHRRHPSWGSALPHRSLRLAPIFKLSHWPSSLEHVLH
jgi:hypothetical protein